MKFAALLAACAVGCLSALGPVGAQTSGVSSGETLYATMQTPLDSKTAAVGDRFIMDVVEPFPTDTDLTGAKIVGHVAKVMRAGQGTKPEIDLAFDRLSYADGASAPISATLGSLQSKTASKSGAEVAAKTLGGLILGNVIGKTIFHVGGGGLLGAIGGFLYGENDKSDLHVSEGAQAQLTLTQPIRPRRQAPGDTDGSAT